MDRTKPPQTPPIPGYKLPPVFETKLPNGLAVVLVEDARFPLVTARLNFQAGSQVRPQGHARPRRGRGRAAHRRHQDATARQISEETDAHRRRARRVRRTRTP